ncbi:MAG: hypothetical protein OXI66_03770 [Boseongicola sp.]|nr:hypothetical protein [Boseongicola sp.]
MTLELSSSVVRFSVKCRRILHLLGAWVLARRENLKELGDLVAAELAGFLEQGQPAHRQKTLPKDLLRK